MTAAPSSGDAGNRQALQLSAALWSFFLLFASVHNFTMGRFRTPVEIGAVGLATLSAVGFAWLAHLGFKAAARRDRARAARFLLIIFAAAVIQTVAEKAIGLALVPGVMLNSVTLGFSFFIYFFIYSLNLAIFLIVSAEQRARRQAVQLAQAEAERLNAELQSLRLKLNPHFLFNALDAALSLVTTGRAAEGSAMIAQLAHFLRSTLELDAGDIPLRDELSIVDDYLEVEAVRFPDRLRVEIDCDPEVSEALVPALLLQPLVENAVKYAVSGSLRPVTISVRARRSGDDLILAVEDDGPGVTTAVSSGTGVGQAATRSRLMMRHGDRARFSAGREATGYRVALALPLIYAETEARAETASFRAA